MDTARPQFQHIEGNPDQQRTEVIGPPDDLDFGGSFF